MSVAAAAGVTLAVAAAGVELVRGKGRKLDGRLGRPRAARLVAFLYRLAALQRGRG